MTGRGSALEKILLARGVMQEVRVSGYNRKDGTHVDAHVRMGVKGMHTVHVKAEDLRPNDVILANGRPQMVENIKPVLGDAIISLRDGNDRRSVMRTKRNRLFKKIILGIMAVVIGAGVMAGAAKYLHADHTHHDQNPVTATMNDDDDGGGGGPDPLDPPHDSKPPAPTTAKGYQHMFDQVSTDEWGGADVAYSTDLPDGRRVWIYGDTMSANNGFVHSTAITQDGGSLHVSHGGRQLLPNGGADGPDRTIIYWPEIIRPTGGNHVEIVAAPTSVGNKNVWDFHRADPRSRVALGEVDGQGNVTFTGWKGYEQAPDLSYDHGEDFTSIAPHHFTYAKTVHDTIALKGGAKLVTVAQNWDDSWDAHRNADGSLKYEDWRPLFYSTNNVPGGLKTVTHTGQ